MDQITDHSDRALARLAEQLKGKTNLASILSAFSGQHQEIEDALWQLYTSRSLDTAFGAQLDFLGRVVNESRGNSDDTSYRLRLKAKIKLDLSSGTTKEILEIFELLTDNALRLEEQFPAAIVLHVDGATDSDAAAELLRVLRRAKAAGVRAILEWFESETADMFTLDSGLGLDQGNFAGGLD